MRTQKKTNSKMIMNRQMNTAAEMSMHEMKLYGKYDSENPYKNSKIAALMFSLRKRKGH